MRLIRKLFPRLSRHKGRRDEDLQGRPARPEVEANLRAVVAHRYADRTKSRATRKRPGFRHYRFGHRGGRTSASGFGNPRWMRAEGVTPFGISSGRVPRW
jgi:hypothetical protein